MPFALLIIANSKQNPSIPQFLPQLFANPENFSYLCTQIYNSLPTMDNIQFDKIIHLDTPGTLNNFISDQEKMALSSLKITGYINATDIDDVLDEMCDAVGEYDEHDDYIVDFQLSPKLRILDLGECTFVGNTKLPYFGFIAPLKKMVFPKGIEYMTDEIETGLTESETLEEVVLQNGIKVVQGLACCSNLKTINLPASVQEVDEFAFGGCDNLQHIFIPKGERQRFEQMIGLRNFRTKLTEA